VELAGGSTRFLAPDTRQDGGWRDAVLDATPLCFVHLPKTGGASVGRWLESQFDSHAACPAWNPEDFELLGPERVQEYQLWRGHLVGKQLARLEGSFDLFTLLRDPVSRIHSAYRWLRGIDSEYWRQAEADARSRGEEVASSPEQRDAAARMMELAARLSLQEFVTCDDPVVRLWTENLTVTQLDPCFEGNEKAPRGESAETDRAGFLAASRVLRSCRVVGVLENLDQALELLCAARAWAAAPRLPNIHRTASEEIELDESTAAAVRARNAFDLALFCYARLRAQAEYMLLVQEAGGREAVRRYLDERHRVAFFARAVSGEGFELDAERAWPGCGWGLREYDDRPQYWRWLGETGSASILAKIEPSRDCLLTLWLHTLSDDGLHEALEASVGGQPLVSAGGGFSRGRCYRDWVIPAERLASVAGDVEIRFSLPTQAVAGGARAAASAVCCRPWDGDPNRPEIRAQRWLHRWVQGPLR